MGEFAMKEKSKENCTGIPSQFKKRKEQSMGSPFDDVRVHYNSDRPAKLGSLAYTQGNQVEIGAGRKFVMPHTGNTGTDIVQRYINVDDCVFAQAPKAGGQRKVMVKNGEPATIYFEESVNEKVSPLDRLGIKRIGEAVECEYEKGVRSKFVRYGQERIPDVTKVKPPFGYEEIGEKGDEKQPKRPEEEKGRASRLLFDQFVIIDYVLVLAQKLQNDIMQGKEKETSGMVKEAVHEAIGRCDINNSEPDASVASVASVAMLSLGQDIILDMFALRNIANRIGSMECADFATIKEEYGQMAKYSHWSALLERKYNEIFEQENKISFDENNQLILRCVGDFVNGVADLLAERNLCETKKHAIHFHAQYSKLSSKCEPSIKSLVNKVTQFCEYIIAQFDNMIALEIVIEDLRYRQQQITKECQTVEYIPQSPTGCDFSSNFRSLLIGSPDSKALFDKQTFGRAVSWPYHYATPIPLPNLIGEKDRLFIEDAVGKSSYQNERANAHWVAHIYGCNENGERQEDKYEVIDCRFNRLSEQLRRQFFESKKITENSIFTMEYGEGMRGGMGKLEMKAQDNLLQYKLNPAGQSYMNHFLMNLMKTITDDFVLQAFTLADEKDLGDIQDKRVALVASSLNNEVNMQYTIETLH